MLKKGSVVRSLAGRDKDRLLMVTAVQDDAVLVCDGKERPLERAKRKNPRHIADTGFVLDKHAAESNRALRKALSGAAERVRPDER